MQNTALDLFYVTKIPFYIHQAQHVFFAVVRVARASGLDNLPITQTRFLPQKLSRLTAFLRQAVFNGEWKEEVTSCSKREKEACTVCYFS